ncbi:hypothetical protein GCM10010405_51000 [Streptomyces macrosporus]|uniref:Uncharacterized protein n=1 Tax=Streptomyces macrosporus TaxID=44032 RepID=A0ABN3KL13_9ACTN
MEVVDVCGERAPPPRGKRRGTPSRGGHCCWWNGRPPAGGREPRRDGSGKTVWAEYDEYDLPGERPLWPAAPPDTRSCRVSRVGDGARRHPVGCRVDAAGTR